MIASSSGVTTISSGYDDEINLSYMSCNCGSTCADSRFQLFGVCSSHLGQVDDFCVVPDTVEH